MQRHKMAEIVDHSRSNALEQPVKNFTGAGEVCVCGWEGVGGGGLKSILRCLHVLNKSRRQRMTERL